MKRRIFGKQPELALWGPTPSDASVAESASVPNVPAAQTASDPAAGSSVVKCGPSSSSSSSSSDSEDEQVPLETLHGDGTDSESNDNVPAPAAKRARIGLVTWSCPRTFPSALEERKKAGCLLPEDMSKEEFGNALLKVLKRCGLLGSLRYLVIAQEYHRKYMAHGGRAVHYHAVLAMQAPFAHRQMSDMLASQFAIKAWFTFNLIGLSAYLRYLFEVGGKKLEVDRAPYVHPPGALSWDKIQAMIAEMPRDQAVKNNLAPKRQLKRKTMTFSELTDVVVSSKIMNLDDLWKEAKVRKMNGDDSLWNKCGEDKALQGTLRKILSGWFGDANSPFRSSSPYSLTSFNVPKEAEDWVNGAFRERTLILSGGGGLGKTSLAGSLLLKVARRYVFITRLDQLRNIDFPPDCGLLWDEATMKGLDVDEMKCVMDLEHTRAIRCRNVDGIVPSSTPRIFSCNHSKIQFFGMVMSEHHEAIERRHIWCSVAADLRKSKDTPTASLEASAASLDAQDDARVAAGAAENDAEVFEDYFGHGSSLG